MCVQQVDQSTPPTVCSSWGNFGSTLFLAKTRGLIWFSISLRYSWTMQLRLSYSYSFFFLNESLKGEAPPPQQQQFTQSDYFETLSLLRCCGELCVSSKRVCVFLPTVTNRTHYLILQELPKYLRGYHACTREETIRIAALLFTIKVNNDKSQFVMIPKMLKELVPSDQLKSFSENEWKKVWRTMLFINNPFHLNPVLLFCSTYYICGLCVLYLC